MVRTDFMGFSFEDSFEGQRPGRILQMNKGLCTWGLQGPQTLLLPRRTLCKWISEVPCKSRILLLSSRETGRYARTFFLKAPFNPFLRPGSRLDPGGKNWPRCSDLQSVLPSCRGWKEGELSALALTMQENRLAQMTSLRGAF